MLELFVIVLILARWIFKDVSVVTTCLPLLLICGYGFMLTSTQGALVIKHRFSLPELIFKLVIAAGLYVYLYLYNLLPEWMVLPVLRSLIG